MSDITGQINYGLALFEWHYTDRAVTKFLEPYVHDDLLTKSFSKPLSDWDFWPTINLDFHVGLEFIPDMRHSSSVFIDINVMLIICAIFLEEFIRG